jgi:hypothetical protein
MDASLYACTHNRDIDKTSCKAAQFNTYLNNMIHGKNISSTSGEPEFFAQKFFEKLQPLTSDPLVGRGWERMHPQWAEKATRFCHANKNTHVVIQLVHLISTLDMFFILKKKILKGKRLPHIHGHDLSCRFLLQTSREEMD